MGDTGAGTTGEGLMSEGTREAPPRARMRKAPDERRDQILSCARELFSRRPYTTVSSTEIAAAAGVSRGLLNHYFGTKRELYLAAVREMMSVPPIPVPPFVAGVGVAERVAQSIDGWLELLQRNRQTWITALEMTSGGDAGVDALLEEARNRAVDHMAEIVGLGRLTRAHPQIRAAFRGYSAMAEATSREWLKHDRLTRAQVHLLLEDVLLNLIDRVLPRLVRQIEDGAGGDAGDGRAATAE